MTEREQFEAWARSKRVATSDFHFGIWQASRRAALDEAHTVCRAGVNWSPEPTKHVQFYVNGTCHRLAAEISQLSEGGKHE